MTFRSARSNDVAAQRLIVGTLSDEEFAAAKAKALGI
jgi:hypothetical protein